MFLKEIIFTVKVQYETSSESEDLCADSMKDNLFSAIENERVKGGFTPDNISANCVGVKLASKSSSESAKLASEIIELVDSMISNGDISDNSESGDFDLLEDKLDKYNRSK